MAIPVGTRKVMNLFGWIDGRACGVIYFRLRWRNNFDDIERLIMETPGVAEDLYKFAGGELPVDFNNAVLGLEAYMDLLKTGELTNISQLLPFLFTLKGKPLTLREHFPMECQHDTVCPPRSLLKTARQISKSTSMAIQTIVRSVLRPYTHTVFVAPLFEQTRRYSEGYVRPMIAGSHFKHMLTGEGYTDDVLRKTFRNGSKLTFTYAFLDADRTRGLDADIIQFDECLAGDTPVRMADGTDISLDSVTPGMRVLTVNEATKRIEPKVVLRFIRQGEKEVFSVVTTCGTIRATTSTQKFWSKNAWKTLDQLSKELSGIRADGEPAPTIAWVSSWGRKSPSVKPDEQCALHSEPRRSSKGIRRAPGTSVGSSGYHRTTTGGKRRVWRNDTQIRDDLTSVLDGAVPTHTQHSAKVRDAQVVCAAVSGGSRILVHGRRESGQAACHDLDTRIQTFRAVTLDCNAQPVRRDCGVESGKPHEISDVLPLPSKGRERAIVRNNCALRSEVHGLQVGLHAAEEKIDLQVPDVRESVCVPNENRYCLRMLSRLPEQSEARIEESLGTAPGKHEDKTGSFACISCSESGAPEENIARVCHPKNAGPTAPRQSVGAEDGVAKIEEARILAIIHAGTEQTFDLTVEDNHNFIVHGGCVVHNCQDLDTEFIPVIESALGASHLHLVNSSGTPKTSENYIHKEWLKSSQGTWVIPCREPCGHYNVMNLEMDLEKCIGPRGLTCAKCQRDIDSSKGSWYHFQNSRTNSYPGWHVPQVILPLHYNHPAKWLDILTARDTWPRYRYLNEILGETCDVGSRLVTLDDWRAACSNGLPYEHNDLAAASAHAPQYHQVVMGIDWGVGGGGQASMRKGKLIVSEGTPSYTAVAVVGFKGDLSRPDLLFSEIIPANMDPREEMKHIYDIFLSCRCQLIAHDYGGAGFHREQMLRDLGLTAEQTMPCQYTPPAPLRPIVFPQPMNGNRFRWSYMVDKTRSLSMTCKLLQKGMLRGPRFSKSFQTLAEHFLALVETRATSRYANDTYMIQQNPSMPSDFAHALNLAMCGAWNAYKVYPAMNSIFGEILPGMSMGSDSHVVGSDDDDEAYG